MITKAKIIGSYAYFPETIIENETLEKRFNLEPGFIKSRAGIEKRRTFKNINLNKICLDVILEALADAKLNSIDSIVIGKDIFERNITPIINFIKTKLIAKGINVKYYSVESGCPGSIFAIGKESKKIENGEINNSLIISISTLTNLINEISPKTSVLWGDVICAIVLEKSLDDSGLIYFEDIKDITLDCLGVIKTENNNYCAKMDSRGVVTFVLNTVPKLLKNALKETNLNLKDIDHFIFHQASGLVLNKLTETLKIPIKKVPTTLNELGNTGIASPLITYHKLKESNKIKKGMTLAIFGFGIGENAIGMEANIVIFKI